MSVPALSPQQGAAPQAADLAPPPRELPPQKAAAACLATAQALEQKGHEKEAIAEYERARQYDPHLKQVSRRLAVLYDRQGAYERALAEFRQALQAQPRDADLLNDLGYCFSKLGDGREAEKWLRQALAVNAGHQRAWINLALALGQQERFEESYAAFITVLKPAEAHSNMGVLLAKHGKIEPAKQAFRQALALQPDLKQAQVFLKVLDKRSAVAAATAPPVRSEAPGNDVAAGGLALATPAQ